MKDPFSADLSARPVVKKLRERDVQEACVAYARSKGFWARKFSSPSQRSVPDYLFGKRFFREGALQEFRVFGTAIISNTFIWAEEFKAPGEHSTEKQTKEQDKMAAAGWTVIRDTGTRGQADIEAFKARIDAIEQEKP